MRYSFLICCVMLILITTTACRFGWKQTEGVQVLPKAYPGKAFPTPAEERLASRRIAIAFPAGWHWVMRHQNTMATRDGVFLQNILIERIHVDQVHSKIITLEPEEVQPSRGWPISPVPTFATLARILSGLLWAQSSRQWPFYSLPYLKKRFAEGMVSTEVADVILDSLANNPSVTDLQLREVAPLQFAGNHGFRAVFDFRLNTPDDRSMLVGVTSAVDVSGRKTPYRSVYYGFMRGKWFYGISYTAALRHYFEKDIEAFESVLQSFQLVEE